MVARDSGIRTRFIKVEGVIVPLEQFDSDKAPIWFRIVIYSLSIIIIALVMAVIWCILP
jgi:hypothetical protein